MTGYLLQVHVLGEGLLQHALQPPVHVLGVLGLGRVLVHHVHHLLQGQLLIHHHAGRLLGT